MMNNNQNAEVKEVVGVENPSPTVVEAPLPLPPSPPVPQLESMMPFIESEPKTLFHGELSVAREAALEILKTHTTEEAMQIFLTGLQPVGKMECVATENAAVGYDTFAWSDTDCFDTDDEEEDLEEYDDEEVEGKSLT